ncbi:hypothetical protein FF011L_28360 [Roseimaritima multifibrata]|uniref:Uncharacterized protein n=1 Tax=Roseimaritima multifibrata TaxID=1930274 RepID=A0A517MGP6_9BACT|nr:hypothetical protein FF011L_28360 [Roseimaritima multifibrata]
MQTPSAYSAITSVDTTLVVTSSQLVVAKSLPQHVAAKLLHPLVVAKLLILVVHQSVRFVTKFADCSRRSTATAANQFVAAKLSLNQLAVAKHLADATTYVPLVSTTC